MTASMMMVHVTNLTPGSQPYTLDALSLVGAVPRRPSVRCHLTVEPATQAEAEADEAEAAVAETAAIAAAAAAAAAAGERTAAEKEEEEEEEEEEVFVSIDLSDLSERRELLPKGNGVEADGDDVDSPRGIAAQRGSSCFCFPPLSPARSSRRSSPGASSPGAADDTKTSPSATSSAASSAVAAAAATMGLPLVERQPTVDASGSLPPSPPPPISCLPRTSLTLFAASSAGAKKKTTPMRVHVRLEVIGCDSPGGYDADRESFVQIINEARRRHAAAEEMERLVQTRRTEEDGPLTWWGRTPSAFLNEPQPPDEDESEEEEEGTQMTWPRRARPAHRRRVSKSNFTPQFMQNTALFSHAPNVAPAAAAAAAAAVAPNVATAAAAAADKKKNEEAAGVASGGGVAA
jgi:hypothetical protein